MVRAIYGGTVMSQRRNVSGWAAEPHDFELSVLRRPSQASTLALGELGTGNLVEVGAEGVMDYRSTETIRDLASYAGEELLAHEAEVINPLGPRFSELVSSNS